MKAVAVVPGRKDSIHLRDDVAEPRPHADEAVVRMLRAGICGTDLEINRGVYGEAPEGSDHLVLGHESLGRVESGPSRTGLQAGDLVVGTVRRPCTENCPACLSDQSDLCVTGRYRERGIKGLHGFMSEWYAERPRYLVRVPGALRDVAVLLEPLSIVEKGVDQALRMYERASWLPRTALVLGAGPVGLLAALTFRLRGLDVWLASRSPEDSEDARIVAGIGGRYLSTSRTPVEKVPSHIGSVDLLFEATGAASIVMPALQALGRNGIAVLASVTAGRHSIDLDVATWNREMVLGNRIVLGTVNAARRHFEEGLRDMAAAEERWPGWLAGLITRRMPFTEAAQALAGGRHGIKTVLEFA